MSVLGDDAPGKHVGSRRKVAGCRDLECAVAQNECLQRLRLPIGQDEPQHERRHRLAEGQRQGFRRSIDDGAISGHSARQRGMRHRCHSEAAPEDTGQKDLDTGSAKMIPHDNLRRTDGAGARKRRPFRVQWPFVASSSFTPGAGSSRSSSDWPAAGISIQRSATPSGHSCTTGKCSVSPAFRSFVR